MNKGIKTEHSLYKGVDIVKITQTEYSFKGFPFKSDNVHAIKKCISNILKGNDKNWMIIDGICKVKK